MAQLVPRTGFAEYPGDALDDAVELRVAADALRTSADLLSENTRLLYSTQVRHYLRWLASTGRSPRFPVLASTVQAYIDHCAIDEGARFGTIEARLASLRAFHRLAGIPFPRAADRRVDPISVHLAATRRRIGSAVRHARALSELQLVHMVHACPATNAGARDATLLLVGFLGAFRRSELVGIDIEHIHPVPGKGMEILLPRSKTDQAAVGATVYIRDGRHRDTCPIRRVVDLISRLGRPTGPLFVGIRRGDHLTDQRLGPSSVDRIVKHRVRAALDAESDDQLEHAVAAYSAHSLRSGLATAAATAGAREDVIRKQTRHRSSQGLARYVQTGRGFEDHVQAHLELI